MAQKTPDPNHAQHGVPLNSYQNPIDAPVSRDRTPPEKYTPWQFGRTQKIAAKQARFSRFDIKNPGSISFLTTTIGTIAAGSTFNYTATLTPLSPHANEINYAFPYIAVYAGTIKNAANQLYPALGTSQTWGNYLFQGASDWQVMASTIPGTVTNAYTLAIHNATGSPGTVFIVSQFKYLNFNSGSVR